MTYKRQEEHKKKYSRDVSLIIPTFNDGKLLEEAIVSASKSSYKIEEIIVIDDGSITDDAQLISQSLNMIINIPIIYKRKDNGGPSSARNLGINIAQSNWIAFLDSDDIMLPDSISTKFNHFDDCKNKENVAGIYGSFKWSSSDLLQTFNKSYKSVSRNHIGVMGKVPGGAPSYIFRKETLTDIKGFDESLIYNEDFDLLLRLIKSGYQLVGTNEPGFVRNTHEKSHSRSSALKALKGGKHFLNKAFEHELLDNSEIIKRLIVIHISTLKEIFFQLIRKFFV